MRVTRRWILVLLWALLIGCDPEDSSPNTMTSLVDADLESRLDTSLEMTLADDLGVTDADVAPAVDATSDMSELTPLIAEAGSPQSTFVGVEIILDGSESIGAVTYQWDFGDGNAQPEPVIEPQVQALYDAPGRYRDEANHVKRRRGPFRHHRTRSQNERENGST